MLDTRESWQWWRECWRPIYRAAGVTAADRIFFAFSFGPFVGFWSAFAGAEELGAMCITGGAMSNFVADAVNVVGFDPYARLVDYLESRMRVTPRPECSRGALV